MQITKTELIYYNAFNLIQRIGPLRFKKILNYFKSPKLAWEASAKELEMSGLEKEIVKEIMRKKLEISPEKEFEKLEKENIKLITIEDKLYPSLLKEIHAAPQILYVKGKIKRDEFMLAVVGSRKVSAYGRQVASYFARELSLSGITLVSGMAFGIDSIAHRESIKLGKRTIAVLGGGIDEKSIYPSQNRNTAKEIFSNGAVISEYPISTPPLKQHFPSRNRIISGLSKGTLVVEASESSGALITAKFAIEQNREVFAVPGNIYSENSKGTNRLIKLGAKLVAKPEDILEELNFSFSKKAQKAREIIPDNDEEALILKNLNFDNSIHIDALSKKIEMSISSVSSILSIMEIKGKVKNVGGMRYIISK